ncbi:MAG: NAD(+)/NADH kinase [Chloroflexales bacterium]
MSTVGIIANPASGKDIRRLVAHASVFDNNEKINILQRVLLALDAMGVERVTIMPDYYGLGERAIDGVRLASLRVDLLDSPMTSTEGDSTVAAARLRELGAACIIVLGGDGTNRVVAKGCGSTPIVPISTGTNNVFPVMVEGTVAGMAAGLLALGAVDAETTTYQAKRLEVYIDQELADIALVDLVTSSDLFIGTRAIWDPSHIREIVLAQAVPGRIGLSAVGSCIQAVDAQHETGMYLEIGTGGTHVLAPLGPGLVTRIAVRNHHLMAVGDEVRLKSEAGTIALDGERQIEIYPRQTVSVRLTSHGPRVVDIGRCMAEATRRGVFQRLGAEPIADSR